MYVMDEKRQVHASAILYTIMKNTSSFEQIATKTNICFGSTSLLTRNVLLSKLFGINKGGSAH